MIGQNQTLVLLTNEYPYGNSETFLENEIPVLSKFFQEIIIIPFSPKFNNVRETPRNVKVVFYKSKSKIGNLYLLKKAFVLLKILFSDFYYQNEKVKYIQNIRTYISIIKTTLFFSDTIDRLLKKKQLIKPLCYSYWLNASAIAASVLIEKKALKALVCRVHGYDLYEERNKDRIIPFKYYVMKTANRIYAVSKHGSDYLQKKNKFSEKVSVSYLGVNDNGSGPPIEAASFTIVSCSNIVPVKRVHFIAEALKFIDFPMKWVHFGDGPGKKKVSEVIESLSSNVEVVLKGNVANEVVLNFFKDNPVNLFLNVSKSEGLPVSIMEAISFGVPVMATDVGGNSEIVTEKTGVLLPKDVGPELIGKHINNFRGSKMNSMEFRKNIRKVFFESFHAEKNYSEFAMEIKSY